MGHLAPTEYAKEKYVAIVEESAFASQVEHNETDIEVDDSS